MSAAVCGLRVAPVDLENDLRDSIEIVTQPVVAVHARYPLDGAIEGVMHVVECTGRPKGTAGVQLAVKALGRSVEVTQRVQHPRLGPVRGVVAPRPRVPYRARRCHGE